jgi:hypothetical protein
MIPGGHEVEHTVDAEARHEVRPDEWANHRAEPTHEDELAAHGYDSVGRHPVVRVGDADRVEAAVLGGLAFQVPIGRLSDRFDRRIVLAVLRPRTGRSWSARLHTVPIAV